MSERDLSHMNEIELLTYADGELNPADAAAVDEHVAGCSECRTRLVQLRSDLADLSTRHRERKLAAVRAAPSWADLTPEFDRLDRRRVRSRLIPARASSTWWIGAAAAALFAAAIWNFSTTRTVSAAQLLERASSTYAASEPGRRIAVRTRNHSFVRPARLPASSRQPSSQLKILFEQANFNWDDPLSAASFARWRDQLPAKQDRVSVIEPAGESGEKLYRIRTTTSHGVLSDAALIMRVADLRPIRETLLFRNSEIVEISETTATEPVTPNQPVTRPPLIASEPGDPRGTSVGPEEELRVLAALNEISVDLGDPVEVNRDDVLGRLTITGVDIAPGRQEQIRHAIRGIPGVVVEFTQPRPLEPGAPPEPLAPATAQQRSALHDRLEARLGARDRVEQFIDTLLADSESALARSHALRKLAARFPPEVERTLSTFARQVLVDLRGRHLQALLSFSRSIETRLTGLIGSPAAAPAGGCPDWQQCASSVLQASQSFDQVLNAAVAGTDDSTLKAALGSWIQQITALERSAAR